MADGIYVATCGFTCKLGDADYSIAKGTTVRAGHELLTGREELFVDFEVDYEYNEPEGKHAAPPPVAPAPAAAPKLSVKGAGS